MRKENGIIYICKNDIDKNWLYLSRLGFGNFSRSYLKNAFEDYLSWNGHDKIYLTGSEVDKKRRRHTRFVNLYKFYNFCVKGEY